MVEYDLYVCELEKQHFCMIKCNKVESKLRIVYQIEFSRRKI